MPLAALVDYFSEDMDPLSVLVTGSSGFIGTHVVDRLHEAGHRITALDCRPPRSPLPRGVQFYECDLRNNLLPNKSYDAVVHLAALPGVRPSVHDPLSYNCSNVVGTLRLLENARLMGTPHVVFASSSSVYGPGTPLPAEESWIPDPCSPYALTKLHGEQWGRMYADLYGIRFIALRFFSVWGPGQRPDLALESFRLKLDANQPVVIHGDGSQRRDLTHVDDVARAIDLALHWPGPGSTTLNVGTGKNHSVMDMLEAAQNSASALPHRTPQIEHREAHPADVPETLASLVAVREELGWQPSIPFPDGPPRDGEKV
jgi:UDP-glucuronate 4-epimerase